MPHCEEHRIQSALFKWARYSAAETPVLRLMFAIPNGGARDAITGAILKAEGVKPGVPDVFLPVASGPFHGLFIELKSAKGRASPEQREWLTALRERGYATALCHDLGEAIDTVSRYLAGEAIPVLPRNNRTPYNPDFRRARNAG